MYQKKAELNTPCGLEYGLKVFGGKWKPRIICLLASHSTLRYGELRALLENVTDAVLANALRELMEDGVIIRTQYDRIPPRVDYALSDKVRTVVPLLRAICAWAEENIMKEKDTGVRLDCRHPEWKL